jgi:hypothetical protein
LATHTLFIHCADWIRFPPFCVQSLPVALTLFLHFCANKIRTHEREVKLSCPLHALAFCSSSSEGSTWVPKQLPEGTAVSAEFAAALGGAAPRLPRWAGGSTSPTSTGIEFETAHPVLESAAWHCNDRSSSWLLLLENLLIALFLSSPRIQFLFCEGPTNTSLQSRILKARFAIREQEKLAWVPLSDDDDVGLVAMACRIVSCNQREQGSKPISKL